MGKQLKPTANKEETFDKLDIRLGRVTSVEDEPQAHKKSYKIEADFGKYGTKTTVARMSQHTPEELKNQLIIAVLNFEDKVIGSTTSEFLMLGVQYPKSDSGEATFLTPSASAKIGGKVF